MEEADYAGKVWKPMQDAAQILGCTSAVVKRYRQLRKQYLDAIGMFDDYTPQMWPDA